MGTTEFLRDDYTVWNGPCRNKALAPSPDNTRDFARAAQLMSTPFNYLAAPSRPPLEDRGKIRNILGGKHWIWCLTTPFLPKSHPSGAPTAATPESTFPVEQQLTSSPRIFNWDKRRWWGTRGFVCPSCCCEPFQGVRNIQTVAESHLGAPLCCSAPFKSWNLLPGEIQRLF